MNPALVLIGVISALTLSACASPQYNYRPQSTDVSFPPLNTVKTVAMGDDMVRQGKYTEIDSIFLKDQITVGVIGTYTFSTGYYRQVGSDEDSKFFLPENGPEGGTVSKGALTDPFQAIQIIDSDNRLCGVSIFGGKVCTSDAIFDRVKRPSLQSNGFQQTLIYSGKQGDRISIGYREFSNNMARPAFSNDVQYDLKDGSEIGYKGALIEVISATNRDITYKVIKNFNSH